MKKLSHVTPVLLLALSATAMADVSWYVATSKTTDEGTAIGTGRSELRLADNRLCVIQPVSGNQRNIDCFKRHEKNMFTATCHENKPVSFTQVRFLADSGDLVDAIEVGCRR